MLGAGADVVSLTTWRPKVMCLEADPARGREKQDTSDE